MRLVLAPPEGVLVEELHAPDGQRRHLGNLCEVLVCAAADALEVLDAQRRLRSALLARLCRGYLGQEDLGRIVAAVRGPVWKSTSESGARWRGG